LKQKTKAELATELTDVSALVSVGASDSVFSSLAVSLVGIRELKGVLGYILRSNSSAIIDLTDQEKIAQYAILSSQLYESSFEIAKQFSMANIESVLAEGKSVKALCMSIGENRIGVFMEKAANHTWIMKRIHQ
jgi:predicted regulator of Ras-like GTPase activity (Roadblock/LC7/MglB family)